MKPYRIIVSYGDGRPKKSLVFAKNGIEASHVAHGKFPAARSISVIGSVSTATQEKVEPEKQKLMYGCELLSSLLTRKLVEADREDLNGPIKNKETILQETLRLVKQGIPLAQIAKSSGVSRTTLRRWIAANN